ncbi:MAG: hypothetical protein H7308_15230 [Chthonomonadaceae bacterium]|nr:hypothetical protein [Chthonomonadaceae bacterium]
MLSQYFQPVSGNVFWLYIAGAAVFTLILIGVLMAIPQSLRKPTLMGVTFLGGLFFALEFFLPVHPISADGKQQGNFLTPLVEPFGNTTPVIIALAVGLGLVNLFQVHGRRITRRQEGWGNSLAFFIATFAMMSINILDKMHPNSINKNLNKILFEGTLAALDATMFSIIAFYIVSAAYRAFRVRSVEATMLLVTAIVVMLGQIAIGQLLTSWLPTDGLLANFRVENIRTWINQVPNSAAVRAISFGLGIGNLAMALRIWLGLERGSYFEG